MAEIHVLSPRNLSTDQAARLLTDLQSLQESGLDLGNRVPHIQTTGDVLQKMADVLSGMIVELAPPMDRLGPEGHAALSAIDTLLAEVRRLSNMAQDFPTGR